MNEKPKYIAIRNWAEEDRPREKLMLKGKSVLSDAELIAILIGSGTKTMSAVELSRHILSKFDDNLHTLAKCTVDDLKKFKGIGEAKAIAIVSALELGRRRKESEQPKKSKITSSKSVYDFMQGDLLDLNHEQFWVLLLDRANQVIKKVLISSGGVSGTVVDQKIIFKGAIENLASSIVLIHNHPSGNLKPSDQDIKLTNNIKNAGQILEIPVIDHLIFTNSGYFSFADESLL